MTTALIDWSDPNWGGHAHVAAWAPDGTHDDGVSDQ